MAALSQIDQLISAGLGNIKKLSYYRIILSDPDTGVTNMNYRSLTIQLLKRLFPMILNDQVLYNRLRSLLLADNKKLEDFLLDGPEVVEDQHLIGTAAFRRFAQSMVPGQGRVRDTTRRTLNTVRKAANDNAK